MAPFGLDLKSIVIGMLLAYFALPWILGMLAGRKGNRTATV